MPSSVIRRDDGCVSEVCLVQSLAVSMSISISNPRIRCGDASLAFNVQNAWQELHHPPGRPHPRLSSTLLILPSPLKRAKHASILHRKPGHPFGCCCSHITLLSDPWPIRRGGGKYRGLVILCAFMLYAVDEYRCQTCISNRVAVSQP